MLVPYTESQIQDLKNSSENFRLLFEAQFLPVLVRRLVFWREIKKNLPIPIEQVFSPETIAANEGEDKWFNTSMGVFSELGRAYVFVLWTVQTEKIEGKYYRVGIIARANLSKLEAEGEEPTAIEKWAGEVVEFRDEAAKTAAAPFFYIFDVIQDFFKRKQDNENIEDKTANELAKKATEEQNPTTKQLLMAAAVLAGKAALQAQLNPKKFIAMAMEAGGQDQALIWLFLLFLLSQR